MIFFLNKFKSQHPIALSTINTLLFVFIFLDFIEFFKTENMDKFQDVKIRLLQSDGTSSEAQKTFNVEIKVVDQMTLLKATTGMFS